MKKVALLGAAILSFAAYAAPASEQLRVTVSYQDTKNPLRAGAFKVEGETRQAIPFTSGDLYPLPDGSGNSVVLGVDATITPTFGPPAASGDDYVSVELDWTFSDPDGPLIRSLLSPTVPGLPRFAQFHDRRITVLTSPGSRSYQAGRFLITVAVERPKPVIRLPTPPETTALP